MTDKKLRSGVYADVKNICEDVGKELNVGFDKNSWELIGELVWKKLLLYSQDLEAFSKHAKRASINTDDVKLLCRRNTSLKNLCEKEYPTVTNKGESSNINRKKRKASANISDD